ncbi:MAG: ATP-binding cassette domain-containing protein [Thiobacillaceae bacterium]|nr:ATP-binding cassette domain-containing protein [Thiobacillaceae bacterium]MDW8324005.1 ATP-binding cassette domain-containing protein [Burkholderiales bacterium]
MSPLSLHQVTKRYAGQAVVDGLTLALEPGRCHGLLGPNGAGKTTTLRLALGLIVPDAGDIRLLGRPVPREAAAARQRVGVVPQADSLDPDFSVRENLIAYGRYFGLGRREIEARIPALLEFAGLTARAQARVPTLSGGMRRRLALARALVNDPELIILDEPTTGLDPQARHLVWQGLRRLIQQGKTLLLTTHFMEEAERLCDTISIIDHGRIIAAGSPRELIRRHIEPHVVEVYGEGAADWASHARRLCRRCEQAGETLFCYTDDARPLTDALDRRAGVRYLHRPANLEDVFLKLTGRDLRE